MNFDPQSRYLNTVPMQVTDARGRTVNVVVPPPALDQALLGIHLLRQGERVDLLAALYLDNPAAFWRIAEMNDVMLPEALTEQPQIEIPVK